MRVYGSAMADGPLNGGSKPTRTNPDPTRPVPSKAAPKPVKAKTTGSRLR